MQYQQFGHHQNGKPGPVEQLMSQVDGKIDNISLKLVLQEKYEDHFAIFGHQADATLPPRNQRPLALVALHPSEDTTNYSALYRMIARYRLAEINSRFGLSLDKFMELPHEICELLFKLAGQAASKDTKTIEKALEEMRPK